MGEATPIVTQGVSSVYSCMNTSHLQSASIRTGRAKASFVSAVQVCGGRHLSCIEGGPCAPYSGCPAPPRATSAHPRARTAAASAPSACCARPSLAAATASPARPPRRLRLPAPPPSPQLSALPSAAWQARLRRPHRLTHFTQQHACLSQCYCSMVCTSFKPAAAAQSPSPRRLLWAWISRFIFARRQVLKAGSRSSLVEWHGGTLHAEGARPAMRASVHWRVLISQQCTAKAIYHTVTTTGQRGNPPEDSVSTAPVGMLSLRWPARHCSLFWAADQRMRPFWQEARLHFCSALAGSCEPLLDWH